jgi:hypothetical protein
LVQTKDFTRWFVSILNGFYFIESVSPYANQYITEIHHILPDGTVRILACNGQKLEEAIVLTADAFMEREMSAAWLKM